MRSAFVKKVVPFFFQSIYENCGDSLLVIISATVLATPLSSVSLSDFINISCKFNLVLLYCARGLTIEEATSLSYNAVVLFNECESLCFGIESGLCTEEVLRLASFVREIRRWGGGGDLIIMSGHLKNVLFFQQMA